MANFTNLPRDLTEEIVSRVPVTSLRRIRCACKRWNTFLKDEIFTKKLLAQAAAERKAKGEILAILLLDFKLSMVSLNRHKNEFETIGNLTSLNDSDQLDINRVCLCDGLVLCVTEDYTRFVVWNPYTGETRWICAEPIPDHRRGSWYGHALGYDKSRTHKVLRFFLDLPEYSLHEIYHVNSSNSRRVLDVTPDWEVEDDAYGASLKGNAYWYARDKDSREAGVPDFLLCFDFTRERFVPRLPLPFISAGEDTVMLSTVREEHLVVLWQNCDTYETEIWVTTQIEPDAVSWSKFLTVDMSPPPLIRARFSKFGSFILDMDKTAVVFFDVDNILKNYRACFIGADGYFREVDIGAVPRGMKLLYPFALSYVPSSVQINQPTCLTTRSY